MWQPTHLLVEGLHPCSRLQIPSLHQKPQKLPPQWKGHIYHPKVDGVSREQIPEQSRKEYLGCLISQAGRDCGDESMKGESIKQQAKNPHERKEYFKQ